ncbi:hypothetical protein [Cetobacterium sp.]|uniref:hypothetical protein n=1 Tax=Cetobacterium sp. TaxID=2071632 RepID=UPI003F4187A8
MIVYVLRLTKLNDEKIYVTENSSFSNKLHEAIFFNHRREAERFYKENLEKIIKFEEEHKEASILKLNIS